MATKLSRTVTYLDPLLPIKSYDPLIIWSCKITWQTKITIFLLTRVPVATTPVRMATYFDGSCL